MGRGSAVTKARRVMRVTKVMMHHHRSSMDGKCGISRRAQVAMNLVNSKDILCHAASLPVLQIPNAFLLKCRLVTDAFCPPLVTPKSRRRCLGTISTSSSDHHGL